MKNSGYSKWCRRGGRGFSPWIEVFLLDVTIVSTVSTKFLNSCFDIGHLGSVSNVRGTFFMVRVVESNSNRSTCLMFLYLPISIGASSIE